MTTGRGTGLYKLYKILICTRVFDVIAWSSVICLRTTEGVYVFVIHFGVQFQVRDIIVMEYKIKSPIETTLERVTCKLLHLCISSYK